MDPTRRRVLAATALASAAVIYGRGKLTDRGKGTSDGNSLEQDDPDGPDTDLEVSQEPPEDPTEIAENIREYGAAPNPGDPDIRSAMANLSALRAAANEAGEGGTIYIPEGTYYIGHDGSGRGLLNGYGIREPAGISIIGDGPRTSTLAVTEHMPDRQNHDLFYWWEDQNHGNVRVREIRLDGNYENLGNLAAQSSGSRACVIKGGASGTFEFSNVYVRGWYTLGVRLTDVAGSAVYCTFEENGIGLHESVNGDIVSHHTSVRPKRGNEFVFQNCYFNRCSGDAVNIGKNQGDITLRQCYGESLGNGVHKISGGRAITHEHCYWEPHTEWLETNLSSSVREMPFYGRNMAHRLTANTSVTPTLRLDNVELRQTTNRAISVTEDGLRLEGDMIAFHDNALRHRDHCFNSENSDDGIEFAIDRLSVHGTRGEIFNCSESRGQIEVLSHDDNEGMGELGNLTISEATEGAEPLRPEVPSRSVVGINAMPDNF